MKFRVWARETRKLFVDVDADSREDAIKLAAKKNKSEFEEEFTDMDFEDAYETYDDENRVFKVGERVMFAPSIWLKKFLWREKGTIVKVGDAQVDVLLDNEKLRDYGKNTWNSMLVHVGEE